MNSVRSEKIIVICGLSLIALVTAWDVVQDIRHGSTGVHVFIEGSLSVLSALGAVLLFRKLREALDENILLKQDIHKIQVEAKNWKERSSKYVEGLSKVIDEQFDVWKLTLAEKEIALLLLKGMSLKEIADIRSTSERTARQQALTIYQKSGLSGRAELSAFFLEDLLAPPS